MVMLKSSQCLGLPTTAKSYIEFTLRVLKQDQNAQKIKKNDYFNYLSLIHI